MDPSSLTRLHKVSLYILPRDHKLNQQYPKYMKETMSVGGFLMMLSYSLALLSPNSGIAETSFALGVAMVVVGLAIHFMKKERPAPMPGSPRFETTARVAEETPKLNA
ncbi:MAG: hypothetical protein JRN15_16620 [Nitrososphaerota archaeon]|nr:hypothetical protein [Nitrososphaerota archaeon]